MTNSPFFFGDGLFSAHFLAERVAQTTAWADEADADAARRSLRALFAPLAGSLPRGNEEDVEDRLVAPVLAALGFGFEKRRMIAAGANRQFPDFLLYAGAGDAERAFKSGDYWDRCLGLLEAKRWGEPLQTPAARKSRSPHLQLRDYLSERPRLGWGVVTNGGEWRLYARDAPASDFFAINLSAILTAPEADADAVWAFRLFFSLFRRAAFDDGARTLREARAGAERFREEIEAQLRRQVFDATETLALGFLSRAENELSEADLPTIFENTLILLYRVLFVLNAEARDLLPTDPASAYFASHGLESVRRKLSRADTAAEYADTGTFALWGRMEGLFDLINGASGDRNERLGVPRYNGGLFDPARYPFLKRCKVADVFLARALETLTFRKEGTRIVAFDYAGLGERHLGSIYEGLLEHTLALVPPPAPAAIAVTAAPADAGDGAGGAAPLMISLRNDRGERKAQGAYYTPQEWVAYLVAATLQPLLDRISVSDDARAGVPDSFADAVLRLTVCDPAMGSAHFLVEATAFLADAAAAHPTTVTGDAAYWRRRVVESCIYGVDRNPLAVELAKLALWLKTVDRVPLNFLDHHLRRGNSLVGTTLDALPRFPDPKRKVAANKKGAIVQLSLLFSGDLLGALTEAIRGIHEIAGTATDTHAVAKQKEKLWRDLSETVLPRFADVADLWTVPYFGGDLRWLRFQTLLDDPQATRAARADYGPLLDGVAPFHWELAFPDVFYDETGAKKSDPGFDAVVGNPPWERIKLAENEFFAQHPAVAGETRASDRKAAIAALKAGDPALFAAFTRAKEDAENALRYVQNSGFYPLMGRGDTNLYAVFVEKATQIIARRGRIGLLVPSGIATDNTTAPFFRAMVEQKRLSQLLDFENKAHAFPDVDSRFKFSVIVLSGADDPQEAARCGFFLHQIEDVADPARTFSLTPADFALFNPNTLTCPIFRRTEDKELTRKLYAAAPIPVLPSLPSPPPPPSPSEGRGGSQRESGFNASLPPSVICSPLSLRRERGVGGGEGREGNTGNPWGVRFLRMFDMTNDSHRFQRKAELDGDGFWLGAGNVYTKGKTRYLPLYEGKMVQMYDHRAASVKINPANLHRAAQEAPTTQAEHCDPDFSALSQYWVDEEEVKAQFGGEAMPFLIGYKDVTAPTNMRSVIPATIPFSGVGNTFCLVQVAPQYPAYCLLANLSSFALDYTARQKIGGQHLNFFIVEQFPVIPPERYREPFGEESATVADFVKSRVLELVYTARDMTPFARALGCEGEPFAWDDERRLHLRCQLDALFFLLYGLGDDDAGAILDTFPIVRRADEARYDGRFRTRDLILGYHKAYAAGNVDAKVKG